MTRYRLSPDVVDLIGFCTKDPAPLLPHLDALEPYGQYWFVTITPYGRDIEPGVPPVERVLESFRQLSDQVGADRVGWRYDPIFLSDKYTLDFHRRAFAKMAEALAGYTHACVISFIDLYPKVTRNFPEVLSVGREDRLALGQYMIQTARANGMVLRPCGEGSELAPYGADCGGCMTLGILEKALGEGIRAPKQRGARKACSCTSPVISAPTIPAPTCAGTVTPTPAGKQCCRTASATIPAPRSSSAISSPEISSAKLIRKAGGTGRGGCFKGLVKKTPDRPFWAFQNPAVVATTNYF